MMLQLFNSRSHTKHSVGLKEDLSDEFISNTNDANFTLDADKELIRQAIGVAFAGDETVPGEPLMDWALNHHTFASQEERVALVRFCMTFGLEEDLRTRSFQLCGQAPTEEGTTIVSFASVQEYDPKDHVKGPFSKMRHHWQFFMTSVRLMSKYKEQIPVLMRDKDQKEDRKRFEQKTNPLLEGVDNWHRRYGPKDKHWYVHMVGCNPAFQGQGNGKKLLNKLCDMADSMGQDMYLEAGERNRPFYEKFGFQVQGSIVFEDPLDESNQLTMHVMTRPARKAAM